MFGGLDIVRALRKADSKAMIVLMTGYGSIDSAVEAVKIGAADYLTKPFDLERLKVTFALVREESERRARMLEYGSRGGAALRVCRGRRAGVRRCRRSST